MKILLLFLIKSICSLLQSNLSFLESNLYESHLQLKNTHKEINFLIIKYPNCVLPIVSNNLFKLERLNNKLIAYYYFRNQIVFSYYKVLKKIYELDYFIERGFVLKIYQISNREIKKFYITDSYPVPDFTVPFIAFSTFGTVLGLIFNFFVNK